MSRPLRLEAPGEFFHILARGNARAPLFYDDQDRSTFLEAIDEVVEQFGLSCHAYCLMGNHYHLIAQPRERGLSRAMRQLNGLYAQRFNRRRNRTGHVFEGRFKSLLVDRDSYLLELARYIMLNPVRAGIVDRPDAWPWSSYRATSGWTTPPRFLTTGFLLAAFDSNDTREARIAFVEFVARGMTDNAGSERWETAIRTGGVVGGERFASRFAGALVSARDDSEIARDAAAAIRPGLRELLEGSEGASDRVLAMRSAFHRHRYTIREIAEVAGVHRATVSRAIRGGRGSSGGA
jgi:REP-associated tyrosine transposase